MNMFRATLGAIPFAAVGIALAEAGVKFNDWPFWVILVSLVIAAFMNYDRNAE
jgi:hypothetical protein